MLNDGFTDCDDGSDEISDNTIDTAQRFSCSINEAISHVQNVIRDTQVCDGIFDCRNLIDECLCANGFDTVNSLGTSDICNRICYGHQAFKRSYNSVILEKINSKACQICRSKSILCSNDDENTAVKCISLNRICDGVKDCADGEDEQFCRTTTDASSNSSKSEKIFKCPMPKDPILLQIVSRYPEIPLTAKRCDGKPECFGLADECSDVTDNVVDDPCRSRFQKPEYCEHFALDWQVDCFTFCDCLYNLVHFFRATSTLTNYGFTTFIFLLFFFYNLLFLER